MAWVAEKAQAVMGRVQVQVQVQVQEQGQAPEQESKEVAPSSRPSHSLDTRYRRSP